MLPKRFLLKILPFTILPLAIISVQHYSSMPLGSTTIYWFFYAFTLLLFWRSKYLFFDKKDKTNFRVINWFLLWNIFCIIRGALFMADNYWDYKGLISKGMALLMPIMVYGVSNTKVLQLILSVYVKYALPVFLFFMPFLVLEGWGWYLFPICFLMFLSPTLKIHWKILLLAISLVAALVDISARSHIFKFIIPILFISGFYYARFILNSIKYLQVIRLVFIVAPWFFFTLAVTGTFNIFKLDEYAQGVEEAQDADKQALDQDSRTFLYEEVLNSAKKHGYWILGRTPARGNDTKVFIVEDEPSLTGRNERLSNEANILNIFTWTGIIGVVFYFLIFLRASFLAINKSSNIYIKIIGVYVAFRWAYSWVEDFASVDINNYTIWIMIGFCLSTSFREMNDEEVKLWARGIFGKKYRLAYNKYLLEKGE